LILSAPVLAPILTLLVGLITTGGNAQGIAPPAPQDNDDLVRWTFETHDCVATEDQLLAAYQDRGYGLMGSNHAVAAVAEREDVEVINRTPYTYRFVGSRYCGF
jgi:hypothetical protein